MFIRVIKSNSHKQYPSVQNINFSKRDLSCNSGNAQAALPAEMKPLSLKSLPIKKRACQFLALGIAAMIFGSCQKEQVANPILNSSSSDTSALASGNTPPKVDAGSTKRLIYSSSSNSATLTGSGSDAEGAVTFKWAQIGGNSKSKIEKPTSATTTVSNLQPGLYTYELTVTDKNGTSRKDVTYVTVLQKMTFKVEGVTREILVHPPTGAHSASPIIMAFHGRGGTDFGFAERAFEVNWPEAIVVYPQGLKTSRGSGWQSKVGEVNNGVKDQDLKFFDAIIANLKGKYNVNTNNVFAHGWSNGGEFIYNVLWAGRADKLAGLSPAAARLSTTSGKKPMPMIQVAGTGDDKVSFSKQQESSKQVRNLDKCSSSGSKWASGPSKLLGTKYPSSINKNVVFLQYSGGHNYPFTVPQYIVNFFKEVAGVKY